MRVNMFLKFNTIFFLFIFVLKANSADITLFVGKESGTLTVYASPEVLDMQTVSPDTKKTMSILLKNDSGEDILIENWRSPCVCLEFDGVIDKLSPGAEKKVSITLDGESYRGAFSKYMLIGFHNRNGNLKKNFFLPIKFSVSDEIATSQTIQQQDSRIKFVEYSGGGLENYKNASAWIFAGKNCPQCDILKKELLPQILDNSNIAEPEIVLVNLDKKEYFLFMLELEEKLGVKGDKTPVLLWKNKLYYGNDEIKKLIDEGI